MDKETLSNYGWIVICTLVLAVMIALATPFGEYIKDGVWSTTNGLNDTLNKNMEIAGLSGSGDNNNTPSDEPEVNGLQFGEKYLCTTNFDDCYGLYDIYLIFYEDGSAISGIYSENEEYDIPAGSFSYTDTEILDNTGERSNFRIMENGATICLIEDDEPYLILTDESVLFSGYNGLKIDDKYVYLFGDSYGLYSEYLIFKENQNIIYGVVNSASGAYDPAQPSVYSLSEETLPASAFTYTDTGIIDNTGDYFDESRILGNGAIFCINDCLFIHQALVMPDNNENLNGSATFTDGTTLTWTELKAMNPFITNKAIARGAFYHSTLKEIVIPCGITTIGGFAFYDCEYISEIVIPEGVISIGTSAFEYSNAIKTVTLPSTLKYIDSYAFYNSGVTTINYNGTVEQWNAIIKDSYWNNNAYYLETVVCSDGTIAL